jgi:hypothetical protein
VQRIQTGVNAHRTRQVSTNARFQTRGKTSRLVQRVRSAIKSAVVELALSVNLKYQADLVEVPLQSTRGGLVSLERIGESVVLKTRTSTMSVDGMANGRRR